MNKLRWIAAIVCLALLCGCTAPVSPVETKPSAQATDPTRTEATETKPNAYVSKYSLSNPNATVETRKLYDYLCSLAGKGCLSGQQESTWMEGADYEMDIIYETTGKYPAIRGLDYMHDDFSGVNQRAVEWWKKGGIVTIMWNTGCNFVGEKADALADEIPDWNAVLTEGTPEYDAFVAGMDKAAQALLELQNAGVPVLWRPFHEFDGGWFWWGKGGSRNFIKLWRLMYDRYTNHWGLNNLIWVLPYSGNGIGYKSWYPGDEYCDIVGADSYNGGVQPELLQKVNLVCNSKPHCFHECRTNPTAEELKTTPWIWFMTGHSTYLTDFNTSAALKELYNSDRVITLDELPPFKK